MKRSIQEIIELLVFGLIALLIGTGLLWLVGWVFDLVGVLFKFFAVLIWSLLRFIVPVAVVAAIVYALVRLVQVQRERSNEQRDAPVAGPATGTASAPSDTPASEPRSATEAGKPHASEVWAPPQPSPPAHRAGDDVPAADGAGDDVPAADRASGDVPAADRASADVPAADRSGEAMSDEPDEAVSAPYETSSTTGMDFPAYDPDPVSEFGQDSGDEDPNNDPTTVGHDRHGFDHEERDGEREGPFDRNGVRPYTPPPVESDPMAPDFTERDWDEESDESENTDDNDRH